MTDINLSHDMVEFSISNNAVTHLGRQLYNSTPPALAELIANSFDAYATDVRVHVLEDSGIYVIADNGRGMSISDVRKKYALIGKTKDEEEPFQQMKKRPMMGKKGIGKLSAFSLGDEYTIYSKSLTDQKWRTATLKYTEMKTSNTDTYPIPFKEIDTIPEYAIDETHGFIVIINNIRRKFTTATNTGIKAQLSRRFYLLEDKFKFNVYFPYSKGNINKLNLESNEYYKDVQYVHFFGYTRDEFITQFKGFEDKTILECRNPILVLSELSDDKLKKQNLSEKNITDIRSSKGVNQLRGWMGTVDKPSKLKQDDNDFSNIVVYMNGKIADEDILKNHGNARIANQYCVGEIFADYLTDELDDPITSSRQGLSDDNFQVQLIKMSLSTFRNQLIYGWDDFRESLVDESLPDYVKRNGEYDKWIAGKQPSVQKFARKLFSSIGLLSNEGDSSEAETRSHYSACIGLINNFEVSDLIKKFSTLTSEELLGGVKDAIFGIADLSANVHRDIIRKRLQVIKELQGLVESEEVEDLFQEKLYENPWLISPYWDYSESKHRNLKLSREYFLKLYDEQDSDYKRQFVDILIFPAETTYPIIVELKRSKKTKYSNPDHYSINKQIDGYRKAFIQSRISALDTVYTPLNPEEDYQKIPAYFIAENHNTWGDTPIKMLKDNNVTYCTYSQIIEHASSLYAEHIEIDEETNSFKIDLDA